MPDDYRPTLFDFLAFDALELLHLRRAGRGEGRRTRSSSHADSPVFGTVDEFLSGSRRRPTPTRRTSRRSSSTRSCSRFHKDDEDKSAFLDADLHRLQFGYNKAVGEEKNARYKAALKAFAEANAEARTVRDGPVPAGPASCRARATSSRPARSRSQAMNAFPKAPAASSATTCPGDRGEVRRRSPPSASGPTRCRTSRSPTGTSRRSTSAPSRPTASSRLDARPLAAGAPDRRRPQRAARPRSRCWSGRPTCRPRRTTSSGPRTSPPRRAQARLLLPLRQPRPRTSATPDNVVAYADVWVSDLAIVDAAATTATAGVEGFVLNADDRRAGRRREGPDLGPRSNNGGWAAGQAGKTDKNGLFRVAGAQRPRLPGRSPRTTASSSPPRNDYYAPPARPHAPAARADRLLHRPLAVPPRPDDPLQGHLPAASTRRRTTTRRSPNRKVTVVVQRRERQGDRPARARTNDFGSFTGSFTAPRDRLTGQMTIHVDGDAARRRRSSTSRSTSGRSSR